MDQFLFIIGCLLLSLSLTYLWWVRLRVVMLREDLFVLRDNLFDQAVARDRLNDPGYVDARRKINSLIRFAHLWSWPVFFSVILRHRSSSTRVESDDPAFNELLEASLHSASTRFVQYLLRDTLTGRVFFVVGMIVFPWVMVRDWLNRRVDALLNSDVDVPGSEACPPNVQHGHVHTA